MILVTGATGFLGAYIVQNLVRKGHAVRALHRSRNFPFFIDAQAIEGVEWVEGDVLDVVSLQEALEGVDAVIHAAAIVSFDKRERRRMYQVNVEGTANVVNAALDANVRRFLHVSSIAALGRTLAVETVTEEKKWVQNGNNTHYAISKHEAEMQAWRGFAEGLEGVIINPSTILGYGDWHQSSCALFRNAYKEFPWYTEGINGFVGVEDVAEAAVQLLLSGLTEQRLIVNAENWPFRRLFDAMAAGLHKKPPHKKATKAMGAVAWRLESLRAMVSGHKPLLTRETAKVAHSKTSFDNGALLKALPDFRFEPLDVVIPKACEKYLHALQAGLLTL